MSLEEQELANRALLGVERSDNSAQVLRNEFAAVAIGVDDRGFGSRLAVRCLRTGASTLLDPVILASIASVGAEALVGFAAPRDGVEHF